MCESPQAIFFASLQPVMFVLLFRYVHFQGKRRPLMPMRMPGKAGKAHRAGENLAVNLTRS